MTWYDRLPQGLPPGRLITPYHGETPWYWLSARPVGAGVWASWYDRRDETGLWPLMVVHMDTPGDPFQSDAEYGRFPPLEDFNGPEVLDGWWRALTGEEDDFSDEAAEALRIDAVGREWAGVTDPPLPQGPPERFAKEFADLLVDEGAHLALVPARDGAHALTGVGWTGPLNHDNDTAKFAAVVADWQQRFGARVVGLGFDTLHLSVAGPPTTPSQALRVAAEHFAFCPDNLWQSEADTFPAYADVIVDSNWWHFWWD
jgi:hypothetical protein